MQAKLGGGGISFFLRATRRWMEYGLFLQRVLVVIQPQFIPSPVQGAAVAFITLLLVTGPAAAEPGGPQPSPSIPPATSAEPLQGDAPVRLVPRETTPELVWDPRWPRFRTAEFVATGILAAGIVPFVIIPPSKSPWRAPNGFDESARNTLRLGSETSRDTARGASDFLLSINATFPFFIDALASAYWLRKSRDVAFQMVEIDAEVMVVTVFLQSLSSSLTSRERPFGRTCPADPDAQNRDCFSNNHYRSFFSGHTSTAFAGAGLICSHHMNLSLWGGGAPDILACVGGFASAATTAYLRVAGDQHYLSDVLLGSAIGTLTGLGLPWLLHYRYGKATAPRPKDTKSNHLSWTFAPTPLGGSVVGTF